MSHQLTAFYRAIFWLVFIFLSIHGQGFSQTCNNWLYLPSFESYVSVGDLDVPGTKITVEATFVRTTPYTGGQVWAGDLVSKHVHPTDANYLLRPNNAEITTSNGYFRTPDICEIELNKVYHAAMVYDGSTLKFYRNGFLMSSVPATGTMFQNDFETRIGLYDEIVHNTNLIGYINNVRIWNTVRTQAQIRAYMNTPLPTPATQPGLLAYYTFDNLLNKQGNPAWNGVIGGSASINKQVTNCNFVADSCAIKPVNVVKPEFNIPDTVCVNTPVNITNTTNGATSFYWDFCSGGINKTPTAVNLGNLGGQFSMPVFMDYVYMNGNYYGFLINFNPGKLVRLNFGNSLLNTPTATNLGNVGGVMPLLVEGIQMVQNEGKWYAIIVAGYTGQGLSPRLIKIDFGTDITNITPVATNWGNIGNMQQPIDLHVFQENNNWYGFTVNAENNTITRFNFTNSFDNTPTAVNLGNIGNLTYPTGIFAINDNNSWRVFVVNGGNNSRTNGTWSLTRLDFGTSLLNTPNGVNLGNPGGLLKHPRDLTIMKFCGETVGFAVNGAIGSSDIVKMDFTNGLQNAPVMTSLGNIGNLNFPHSIARIFRVGSNLYSFITNVGNNSLTRLQFSGCTNASIPNSNLQNPPPVVYSTPGSYNINLTVDDGLPTQSSFCKQVVVLPELEHRPIQNITMCDGKTVRIGAASRLGTNLWNTGSTADSITVNTSGIYWVETTRFGCSNRDSFQVTIVPPFGVDLGEDLEICPGTNAVLDAGIIGDSYIWNTGTTGKIISVNSAGKYYVVVKRSTCEASDTVTISTRPDAVFQLSGPYWICAKDSVKLNASGGHVYQWQAVSGLSSYSIPDPIAIPAVTTEYTVTITDTICNQSATLTTKIEALPLPLVKITKSNDIDCRNSQSQLNVTGVGTRVLWNPSPSLSSTTIGNPVATPTTTTTYIVKGTVANGCSAYDTIIVYVHPKPTITVSADTAICSNGSAQLVASGGVRYLWSPETSLNNPLIPSPIASPTTTTRYYVRVLDDIACEYIDSINVLIKPDPVFSVTDVNTCKEDSVQLTASGGDNYLWSPSEGLSSAYIANPIALPGNTREYYVTITESGCDKSATLPSKVTVLPAPIINASSSNVIDCSQDKSQLNVSGAKQYLWSPSVSLNNPAISNPMAFPTLTTEYVVVGTDAQGCKGYDTVVVNVENANRSEYLVPNAFTPNNDGLNDCFRIKFWGVVNEFEFSIFNRWGERLYFTRDPGQCWDGTYKGILQDGGAYVYTIKAKTFCQPEVFRKGVFVLVR